MPHSLTFPCSVRQMADDLLRDLAHVSGCRVETDTMALLHQIANGELTNSVWFAVGGTIALRIMTSRFPERLQRASDQLHEAGWLYACQIGNEERILQAPFVDFRADGISWHQRAHFPFEISTYADVHGDSLARRVLDSLFHNGAVWQLAPDEWVPVLLLLEQYGGPALDTLAEQFFAHPSGWRADFERALARLFAHVPECATHMGQWLRLKDAEWLE